MSWPGGRAEISLPPPGRRAILKRFSSVSELTASESRRLVPPGRGSSMPAAATTRAAHPAPFDRTSRAYERRWWILGVLCFSLLIIVVDNSILNVALPSIQESLKADNSALQWIVDAYTLVFA